MPWRTGLAVAGLLAMQWSLAVSSLLRENPTVDEVVHLPAGVSYWQRGTFQLYPHNPPLIKLIAALPVLAGGPQTGPLYAEPSWGWRDANKAAFAHGFMLWNADRYFELFDAARLLMPTFAVLGGLAVFDWSRRLSGNGGGLISLALWCLCPNILAHCRLVTTDLGATSIGFAATYAFWHSLRRPGWRWSAIAGVALGIAQLTKFSLLLLFGIWPLLWLVEELARRESAGRAGRIGRAALHAVFAASICVLIINLGYGFEGTGRRLESFPFTGELLTAERPEPIAAPRPPGRDRPGLREGLLQYRVNRFRGTPLGPLPVPLPRYYVLGFDDQKTEAEGVPYKARFFADDPRARLPEAEAVVGYPVFLDGTLQSESWARYYVMALLYKVPEGTWALVLLALLAAIATRRARLNPADEAAVGLVPIVVVGVMSVGTNIALGLRYVLPIFPYVFVSVGRLSPWAAGLGGARRAAAIAAIVAGLGGTAAALGSIYPHPLAYFNWASGGPSRGSTHLIDSNLDWGQDLVGLVRWLGDNAPDQRVGIAYFGQINPEVVNLRAIAEAGVPPAPDADSPRPLDWFLPPIAPIAVESGPIDRPPEPGLYAVSASLMRGLPWRVYRPGEWGPLSASRHAFSYFRDLEPIDHVGHSILIYRLDEGDAERLAREHWGASAPGPSGGHGG